jgi:putative endopeptidase
MRYTRRKCRIKTSIPKKPDIPPVQDLIKPGNDFYGFVNSKWIRYANMPSYLSSYGVSEEIESIINTQLLSLIDNCRKQVQNIPDKNISQSSYLIGTLAESALNTQSQKNNIRFLKSFISNFKCLRNTDEVAGAIGSLVRAKIPTILNCKILPELHTMVQRFSLFTGTLGLPDPMYYTEQYQSVLKKYASLLNRLGIDFEFQGLMNIIPLETEMSKKIIETSYEDEVYMTGLELKSRYKSIPWDAFFKAAADWNPSEINSKKIMVSYNGWFRYVNQLFKELTLDHWKSLLASHCILHFLPVLPPPYDDMHFELYRKELRGQSEKIPQKMMSLYLIQDYLTGSLGYLYVKTFVSRCVKQQATILVKDILEASKERLDEVTWLEKSSRERAKKKISNIYAGIAYPDVIERDHTISLNSQQLIQNLINLSNKDFDESLKQISKPLDPKKWTDPVFSVNAYYYNEGNRLILPSGILQWPFFHVGASDGWNYGGIGAVAGHELCHAFDNDGKLYDETGRKINWWTRRDSQAYQKKTKEIIELFNKTKFFGKSIDGSLTLSENIADLAGLALALTALKRRFVIKKVSKEEARNELCNFFISFAVSWRTKEKKEKIFQSLFMDVHSPPFSRVNNVVSQFDEWYECFDVKPGDKLYRTPEQRIRIF